MFSKDPHLATFAHNGIAKKQGKLAFIRVIIIHKLRKEQVNGDRNISGIYSKAAVHSCVFYIPIYIPGKGTADIYNRSECPQSLWENVEGVLADKTNAFGCLVSSLAGLHEPIVEKRWPCSGFIHGTKRNVAWRVLDAKYFGLPQQRKRLYVIGGGTDFFPENVLFEEHRNNFPEYPKYELTFEKDGHQFEVFREYTDCLYAAYGTKWNGNAAATNGSLFVVQDDRIRRLSPL